MNKITGVVIGLVVFCIAVPVTAYAHCDTLDGPVIQDARIALEKGDITPVLKWVKEDAAKEVRAAFNEALASKKENKDVADMKFFETLVRVHRVGEGAPFTGVKPAGEIEPIVAKADKTLEEGSVDPLLSKMTQHLTKGVSERFEHALEKGKHKDESVKAGREYVEAYVEYMHYMEGIHKAVMGHGGHQHDEVEGREQEETPDKK